jgi:hypothetical protein
MKHRLILLSLALPALLAACSTPRERCVSGASRELRVLTNLANETRGNIARGYAIETYQDIEEIRVRCNKINDEGEVYEGTCHETRVIDRSRPVAIDLAEEEAKLRSLEQRIADEREYRDAAVQQCIAIHPE